MSRYTLLMKSLVDKDLRVRYKRSVLGFLWFLLKPLFSMAVYSVVFTRIIRFGGDIPNYSLFLLAGLLPWNFFSASLSGSTRTLLDNHRLIRSVYFPRMALPLASVAANGVHMVLALGVLQILLWAWGHPPAPALLAVIPGVILLCCVTGGLALALSVWNVYYRDVAQFLEVALLAWFYASPVIYPLGAGMIPPRIEGVLRWNPLAGILEILRSAMYHGEWPEAWCWLSGVLWSAVLLFTGILVFRRCEPAVVKEL